MEKRIYPALNEEIFWNKLPNGLTIAVVRRPGFSKAAKPDLAVPLYERFKEQCRARGFRVEQGRFGADMKVASVNDGPVTILYDTDKN